MEETTTPQVAPSTLNEEMDRIRIELKKVGAEILAEKKNERPIQANEDRGEVMANLILAYREVENASMRLGKVKQALNDGESIYDKNVVGSK